MRPNLLKLPNSLHILIRTHPPLPSRIISFRCPRCKPFVPNLDSNPPLPHHRPLTTTPHPPSKSKHTGKPSSKRTVPLNASKTQDLDPFDFTDYEAAVTQAQERLKTELARVKAGGRDLESIEGIRVRLRGEKGGKGDGGGGGKGEKGKGEVVTVGDVASVVRRGRNIAVIAGEKDLLPPLHTALSSPQSHTPLSPTPSPTDPLTLLIPLPPPTTESRHQASTAAHKKGEEALFALREARGMQRKRLRAMELGRRVGPDEMRRAERELERRNGEAGEGVRGCVGDVRRGIEGG
ncbi:hypothetical protein ACLMJK_006947 [Lecanora helva]